jgi:signal peptidase II
MAPDPAASPAAPGPATRHPRAIGAALSLVVLIVVLDQLTKSYAESVLQRGEFVPLLGESVGWQLVYNPGGAFGLPLPSWVFLVVTVLVTVLVLRALPQTPLLTAAMAYGLLLGGALGNVLDRLFRVGDPGFGGGYVVDFVAWGTFPRFNVADSAITVGFALLVVAMLIDERRQGAADADGAAPHPDDADVDAAEQRHDAVEPRDTNDGDAS